MNFFIIHGTDGSPQGNWFPWLKAELERKNHAVYVPQLLDKSHQSLDSWTTAFRKYEEKVNEESVFIGHSIAPAFILSLLERHKVKSCIFVAGFLGELGSELDPYLDTFVNYNFDFEKIKTNCSEFTLFYSDDDLYVPLKNAQLLADKLGVELTLISNAGHFNKDSGFTEFEKILDYL